MQSEERKKATLAAKQQDFEADMAARTNSLTADEAQKLLALHEREMELQTQRLDSERERQKQRLEAQVAGRRKEKEEALRAKQAAQMAKELKQQKAEERDAITDVARKKERAVLQGVFAMAENKKRSKMYVERVLKPRHKRQQADLLKDQWADTAKALSDTLAAHFESMQSKRAELQAQRDSGALTAEDFERASAELDELDLEPSQLQAQVAAKLEAEQAEVRKTLQRAQYAEVKQLVKEFCPEEDFNAPEWQLQEMDIKAVLEQRERKRMEEEAQLQAEIERLRKEEADFKAAQQRKLQEAMSEYDQKMEAERRNHAEELERRIKAQQEQQTREREEMRKKKLDSLANMDPAQQAAILEEHEKELQAQRSAQELELERQKEKFNEKLRQQQEARRRREIKSKQDQQAEAAQAERETRRLELERLERVKMERQQRQDALFKEGVGRFIFFGNWRSRVRARVLDAGERFRKCLDVAMERRRKVHGIGYKPAARSLNPTLVNRLPTMAGPGSAFYGAAALNAGPDMSSVAGLGGGGSAEGGASNPQPFFERLSKIETILSAMLQAEGVNMEDVARRTLLGEIVDPTSPGEAPFLDDREKTLKSDGKEPVVCELSELSAKTFVVYRFGRFVVDLLCRGSQEPAVSVLLAKQLPPKPSLFPSSHSFPHSYSYDTTSRTLCIRQERTEEVGEFCLVVMHAFAHIRALAKAQWDDSHAGFKKEFFSALRLVCGELFFARSKPGKLALTAAEDVNGAGGVSSVAELRQMFGVIGAANLEGREDLLADYMDLQPAGAGSDDFTSGDQLLLRLENYKLFVNSSQLRQQLNSIESDHDRANVQRLGMVTADVRDSLGPTGVLSAAAVPLPGSSSAGSASDQESARTRQRLLEIAIEKLETQSDRLNGSMIQVLSQIRTLSENLLRSQAVSNPALPDSSSIVAAKAKLKRLNMAKVNILDSTSLCAVYFVPCWMRLLYSHILTFCVI